MGVFIYNNSEKIHFINVFTNINIYDSSKTSGIYLYNNMIHGFLSKKARSTKHTGTNFIFQWIISMGLGAESFWLKHAAHSWELGNWEPPYTLLELEFPQQQNDNNSYSIRLFGSDNR